MACDVSQSMTFHLRSCKTHMYSVSPPKNSMFGEPAPAKSDEFVYFFQTRGGVSFTRSVFLGAFFGKKCQMNPCFEKVKNSSHFVGAGFPYISITSTTYGPDYPDALI